MEHRIYASLKNPDRLFKVGDFDVVDHWVNVFRSNPEFFPKIYRAGKFPKYPKLYYVEIEKLDTKKFIENWDNLEMDLEEMGVIDLDNMNGLDQLYLDGKLDLAISDEILDRLADYNRKFIIELLKLVKNCESVVGGSGIIDFHKYNFGYGSDGKIKCLDL